ncbi:ATP-binding protein [Microbacterium sp. 10M-3C3]|jgi:hypothetical protein|uniref:ATP-binding protein n=1 Tax=Microbacterium sp. 10M-3C3 TaxID=2483401 RepID=UPI0013DDC77F|nr:ATP-binding protein [Microbacterium sp. 10M-3C3]
MIELDIDSVPRPNWQTRSGWAAFVEEHLSEPPLLTRKELDALPERDRVAYGQQRMDFICNGRISFTPELRAIRDEMRARMIVNSRKRGGALGVIVDGVPNAGKSTAATWLAKEFELRRRRFGGIGRDAIPVMYVSVPADCTPKSLLMEFAGFIGRPVRPRTTSGELLRAIADTVAKCRTELIIIDEIHNLRQDRQGASDATNYLKQLSEKCGATFLYVGANVADSGLLGGDWADQVVTRFKTMPLVPSTMTRQEGRDYWSALLEDLEANARLVDQEPGDILRFADVLHEASNGRVGEVAGRIQIEAVRAMETGEERLDFTALARELAAERRTSTGEAE